MLTPGMPMIYYGDEVGITGGPDPDCRRGMLWSKDKQDTDMLSWYKKLITIRKNHSCITDGYRNYLTVDNDSNLIIFKAHNNKEELYIIIHNGEDSTKVSSLKGKHNLISDTTFDGSIDGYGIWVLS
jgi:glycosidase